jgi:hypothetical protein
LNLIDSFWFAMAAVQVAAPRRILLLLLLSRSLNNDAIYFPQGKYVLFLQLMGGVSEVSIRFHGICTFFLPKSKTDITWSAALPSFFDRQQDP